MGSEPLLDSTSLWPQFRLVNSTTSPQPRSILFDRLLSPSIVPFPLFHSRQLKTESLFRECKEFTQLDALEAGETVTHTRTDENTMVSRKDVLDEFVRDLVEHIDLELYHHMLFDIIDFVKALPIRMVEYC
ncbi:hypothetical protein TNCV_3472331 [Trichonephila clavipes]|nr:hypothetical protein TNCV_3472331 [Trichonephila clavipes]